MDNKPLEICPSCGVATRISEGGYEKVNDDTPDKETEVYLVQYEFCRNPQCENEKSKIAINIIRHRLI